ncbi:MAG: hypothetical protein K6E20_01050 [Acholeplasmatales bacterium]|nr:hypothetical protein [Acholeplasmatales bacterium]
MFSVGDVVMYTTYGICKVADITEQNDKKFYLLIPLAEAKTRLSLPIDNPITQLRVHELLPKDTIIELLNEIPFMEPYWIDKDNDRKNHFSEVIKSGDRRETIKVIKSIRQHIEDIKDKGRKLHATDKTAMRDAEKLLLDEFSYVLDVDRQQMEIMLNTELEK